MPDLLTPAVPVAARLHPPRAVAEGRRQAMAEASAMPGRAPMGDA